MLYGYDIHGKKDQRDRNGAISQFKKYTNAIHVAMGVAAIGARHTGRDGCDKL